MTGLWMETLTTYQNMDSGLFIVKTSGTKEVSEGLNLRSLCVVYLILDRRGFDGFLFDYVEEFTTPLLKVPRLKVGVVRLLPYLYRMFTVE